VIDPLQWPPVVALDSAADRAAASLRGRRALDRAMYGLTEAANHSMLWHGINAVDALTSSGSRRRRAIRRSAVIAAEQAVVNGPVKMLVGRRRPIPLDDHPHRLRQPRTSSFPSGHSSAGACAATLLTRDLGAAPAWCALAGAVAWSRVHVGVHHASDAVGGALIGHLLARAAAAVWPPPADPGPTGSDR
jgi:undecaprenyl-diphosphatase